MAEVPVKDGRKPKKRVITYARSEGKMRERFFPERESRVMPVLVLAKTAACT